MDFIALTNIHQIQGYINVFQLKFIDFVSTDRKVHKIERALPKELAEVMQVIQYIFAFQ
ncbi:hypothetical protein FACS189418_1580 [Clostridia bacterium]|nr:hypothetical protein FACS189418_1580 [Clostridia bacterium]